MIIAYYSHAGNSKRFVETFLVPKVKGNHPIFVDDPLESVYRGPLVERIEAPSPKGQAFTPRSATCDKNSDDRIVIVFPVYAQHDHETGELTNTVPQPMRNFIETYRDRIVAAIVCGNRTFGKAFCYVNDKERHDIPIVHRLELSGSEDDAEFAVNGLKAIADSLRSTYDHLLAVPNFYPQPPSSTPRSRIP